MKPDEIKALCEKFDHNSETVMLNPYPMYEAFRQHCPVSRSAQYNGFNFVASYAGVKKVLEDYATYSSITGVGIPPHSFDMIPIDLDPPLQTKYRKILNPRFTVEAVAVLRPKIEAKVHSLIDAFITRGSADLAADLVRPLLPAIVLPMMGVPFEDQAKLCEGIEYLTRGRATDPEGVQKAAADIGMYLMGLSIKRRSQPEQDDLIGLLQKSSIDGVPLTDEQILKNLLIILFGGLDTTTSAILESLLYLAQHPEEKTRLMKGDYAWDVAIEEFVRYASPVQGLRRNLTADAELEGQPLKKGEWMFALHGSANRDETVFSEPNKCMLDRSPNPHMGFSAGAHLCLGRNLARLEMKITIKAVLERLGDYRIAPDFKLGYLCAEARGMKALPVIFSPGG